MLKLKDLREGDYVLAEFEGRQEEGTVVELNNEDKEVCVETAVQQFWFKPENLSGIPLTEEELFKLGFTKEERDDNSVKYLRGPFRILVPVKSDFSHMEIWYREDHRKITQQLYVHELQHHYNQMTKVDLVRGERTHEPLL